MDQHSKSLMFYGNGIYSRMTQYFFIFNVYPILRRESSGPFFMSIAQCARGVQSTLAYITAPCVRQIHD